MQNAAATLAKLAVRDGAATTGVVVLLAVSATPSAQKAGWQKRKNSINDRTQRFFILLV